MRIVLFEEKKMEEKWLPLAMAAAHCIYQFI